MTSGGMGGNIIMSVLGVLSIFAYLHFNRKNLFTKQIDKKEPPDFIMNINTLSE